MKSDDKIKVTVAILGSLYSIVKGASLIDKIIQRQKSKKEEKEKREREAEEKKRNGGITDEEKHNLDLKERELDLINRKKAEGFEKIQDVKRKSEEKTETSSAQRLKAVKEQICQLLHLDEYRRPEERSMLEKEEMTQERVSATPLVGKLIKLGDRVIIAGNPSVGKSTFAVQLADDISCGNVSKLLPDGSEPIKPQLTYLYDKEQDSDDRKERMGRKHFSPRLIRMEDAQFPTVYCLLDDLHKNVSGLDEDATFIFDNLKSICGELSPEQTRHLFDGLAEIQKQAIARGIRITIIFVTHLVKDVSGIPEMSDIAGAANLTRFAKNVICLSSTRKSGLVLMNNPKLRHSEKNEPVVLKFEEESEENPMVHFQYVRTVSEDKAEAIMKGTINCNEEAPIEENKEKYDSNLKKRIVELYKTGKKSFRDIANILAGEGIQISHTTVSKIYKDFVASQGAALA